MSKRSLSHSLRSHGIYEAWSGDHKQVPRIVAFTTRIPARVGIEFGYVLHIAGGKGITLDFRIDHPPWRDGQGRVVRPFEGSFPVRSNDFDFFLGDTVCEPWERQCGIWTLTTWHEGRELARMDVELVPPERA